MTFDAEGVRARLARLGYSPSSWVVVIADLAAALDEIDALRAAMAASAEEAVEVLGECRRCGRRCGGSSRT